MMHLANNYSYRFIKDDTNIFTICRRPVSTLIPPSHVQGVPPKYYNQHFYSEAYLDKRGQVNNAILAFGSTDMCTMWQNKIDRLGTPNARSLLDNGLDITMDLPSSLELGMDIIDTKIEVPLYDLKTISDAMHIPLMVIIDILDNNKYEVFYHNIKLKQHNG